MPINPGAALNLPGPETFQSTNQPTSQPASQPKKEKKKIKRLL